VPMLGFDSQGLMNSNEGVTTKIVGSRMGHAVRDTEILANSQPRRAGCPCGSIYSGR
jgi:hypothetical protein